MSFGEFLGKGVRELLLTATSSDRLLDAVDDGEGDGITTARLGAIVGVLAAVEGRSEFSSELLSALDGLLDDIGSTLPADTRESLSARLDRAAKEIHELREAVRTANARLRHENACLRVFCVSERGDSLWPYGTEPTDSALHALGSAVASAVPSFLLAFVEMRRTGKAKPSESKCGCARCFIKAQLADMTPGDVVLNQEYSRDHAQSLIREFGSYIAARVSKLAAAPGAESHTPMDAAQAAKLMEQSLAKFQKPSAD